MIAPKDPKVQVVRSADRLEIEIDQRSTSGWYLAAIGLIVCIGIMFASQFPGQHGPRTQENVISLLIMGPVLGIPILFLGLAVALNKSRMIADRQLLSVQSGPIPYLPERNRQFQMHGVKQLFTRGKVGRKSAALSEVLYLLDSTDQALKVLGVFPSPFAASQICAELQAFYAFEPIAIHSGTPPAQPNTR